MPEESGKAIPAVLRIPGLRMTPYSTMMGITAECSLPRVDDRFLVSSAALADGDWPVARPANEELLIAPAFRGWRRPPYRFRH